MTRWLRAAVCAATVCAWVTPAIAAPAKLCAPTASGVPGRSGPPLWWETPSSSDVEDPQPSDPRWKGATRITRGHGAHEEVSLRVLSHPSPTTTGTKFLYLEWAAHPTAVNVDQDRGSVYLGLSAPGGSGQAFVIRFDIGAATTTSELAGYELYTHTSDTASGSDFQSASTDVDWLTETASVFDDEVPGAKGWFLRARIPIKDASATGFADALPIGTEFVAWTQWSLPIDPDTDRAYAVPDGSIVATEIGTPPVLRTPLVDDWKPAMLGSGDPACAIGGIRLTRHNVGVAPGGDVTVAPEHQITVGAANLFVARPENTGTSNVAGGSIEATFRIADWGSTMDEGEWNEIGTGTLTSTLPAGGTAPITTTWTPPSNYLDSHDDHQCMLVELRGSGSGPTGGAVTFINESVYRNMRFEEASTFSDVATISAKGLPPIEDATERELYLYLEKRNMPVEVNEDVWRSNKRFIDYHLARIRGEDPQSPYRKDPPDDYTALAKLMPTYVVHVYHDTGRTVRRNGKERRVFKTQPSFGYYVDHQGKLAGWSTALDGAEPVGDGWYHLRVEDGGSHVVRTRIQGHESPDEESIQDEPDWKPEREPKPDTEPKPGVDDDGDEDSPPWWQEYWWVLVLVLILLIIFAARRKKP